MTWEKMWPLSELAVLSPYKALKKDVKANLYELMIYLGGGFVIGNK